MSRIALAPDDHDRTEAVAIRDRLMHAAVAHAGAAVPEQKSFRESLLEAALIEGLRIIEPDVRCKQTGGGRARIPNWDRPLGDFDIKTWLPGEKLPSVLIEAKVDDVADTLWDLLKLASVSEIDGAVAGYLAVAASRKRWESASDCVGLYEARTEPKQWHAEQLFSDWSKAWADIIGPHGGAARPLECPALIRTTFIATAPVASFPGYEIRCIRVDPVGARRIGFVDGIPQP